MDWVIRPSCNASTIRYGLSLVTMGLIGLFISIIMYPDPFDWVSIPISDLGATVTIGGSPNMPAMLCFILTMILIAITLGLIGITAWRTSLPFNQLEAICCISSAIGFGLMCAPHNLYDSLHVTGGVIAILFLWLYLICLITEMMTVLPWLMTVIAHMLLHIPIITYAIMYANTHVYMQIAQKIAVVSIGIVLLITTWFNSITACRSQSPWDVLSIETAWQCRLVHGKWDGKTCHVNPLQKKLS